MICRVMKKDEFVARMLADQALRKEREYHKRRVILEYQRDRSARIEHKRHIKHKQGGNWG